MNPSLVQQNTFFPNYPINNKYNYQSSERQYNDTLPPCEYLPRKVALGGTAYDQSMPLTNISNGMDYGSSQLQHDTSSCNANNSQLILTPPQSGDESSSTITNPTSASFAYSNLPKLSASSISAGEYYTNPAPSFLHSNFNGSGMTSLDRRSVFQIPGPAPISPPYSYGHLSSSNSFPSHYSLRGAMDYQHNRQGFGDLFSRRLAQPSLGLPFAGSTSYPTFQGPLPTPSTRQEGPGFDDTIKLQSLVNSRGQILAVDIHASIPKGFFKVDDKWTCYRRNYFSVSCGFGFKTHSLDNQVYVQRYSSQPEPVNGYAVSITAKTAAATSSESETRGLVQHTPKRDKATESTPTRHPVAPAPAMNLPTSIAIPHGDIYNTSNHITTYIQTGMDPYSHTGGTTTQTNYTFERIQFQKATANNGKRRAQQQYFHVVVKLEVNLGRPGAPEDWILVAQKQSHPMVVRGRSPGHYKDNRRDSQTSMDPDGGSGHGADGNSNYHLQPLSGHQSSSIGDSHNTYRHNQNCGSSYSHHTHPLDESENSTASPESSATLASSPNKGDSCRLSSMMTQISLPRGVSDCVVLSPILNKTMSDIMDYSQSRKRQYEDNGQDCTNSYFHEPLDATYHNPSFDFSATSATHVLCTSS